VSSFYDTGLQGLLERTIPAEAGVYVVGVNDEYVFNKGHSDFTPITPHIILPETQLQHVTNTAGFLDADDIRWVAAGSGIADRSLVLIGVIIYFKLADEGSLLAFIDSAAVGLPVTLSGMDATATWDARGILKI
jgi:hypothetical protein